jgi:hypothetical protein
MKKTFSILLVLVLIFSLLPATSQAAFFIDEVPDGFYYGPKGHLSIDPKEVIQGQRSLVGSYHGTDSYNNILGTLDGSFQFSPGQTYTLSFRYKILETPDKGFQVHFISQKGIAANDWLQAEPFTGKAGDQRDFTMTRTLKSYDDYTLLWEITGQGAIAIDSVKVTESATGRTLVETDFEEPPIKQGLLPFQITDTKTYHLGDEGFEYSIRGANVQDLDGDGVAEAVITAITYQDQLPEPVIILGAGPEVVNLTGTMFPEGIPTVKNAMCILFPDLNGDGRMDMIFADAGIDYEPWTGSRMVIAIQEEDGSFDDVSDLIPEEFWEARNYASAVGDINKDGRTEIILSNQNDEKNSVTLTWENKGFTVDRSWIPEGLWSWPGSLSTQSTLQLTDLDKDGFLDLLVGGNYATPSLRIAFGGEKGFEAKDLLTLPDGIYGHFIWDDWAAGKLSVAAGGDINGLVVADFDNDGLEDIFMTQESVKDYKPGMIQGPLIFGYQQLYDEGGYTGEDSALQVFKNQGNRTFTDITPTDNLLGWRYYFSHIPVDINMDGYLDVIGGYWTKPYGDQKSQYNGSTLFLNDGTGRFKIVDGSELFPSTGANGSYDTKQLGIFLPTSLTPNRLEGLFVDIVSDYHSGDLIVRKAVFEGRIGTGSEFSVIPKDAAAAPTNSSVLVNGKPVAFEAYNINGNNYFKLRDIAVKIDFAVTWDGTANSIGINTTMGYTP